MTATKECRDCHHTLPKDAIHFVRAGKEGDRLRLSSRCRTCENLHRRTGEQGDRRREQNRLIQRALRLKDPDFSKKRRLRMNEQQKDRIRAQTRDRMRRLLQTNMRHRLKILVSTRIRQYLKRGGKSGKSWQKICGYSIDDMKQHLERQFSRGMSWENHGKLWHIDHIIPVAKFNLANPDGTLNEEELRACWALSNLRPLIARENRAKSDHRTHLI